MQRFLKELTENSISRNFQSGSTVLYQGEVPRSACVISEGIIKVFNISQQGDEQIIMYHIAGEFFPASWIFEKAPGALFFYEAVTDCIISYVPRRLVLEFMFAKPERTKILVSYFVTNYSAFLIRVNGLEQSRARDKLLYLLYFLSERYSNTGSSKAIIPMNLTHQNIASMVGLTRETTAVEIGKLKKDEILTYAKQQYTVDMTKILSEIGEDAFAGMSIAD